MVLLVPSDKSIKYTEMCTPALGIFNSWHSSVKCLGTKNKNTNLNHTFVFL